MSLLQRVNSTSNQKNNNQNSNRLPSRRSPFGRRNNDQEDDSPPKDPNTYITNVMVPIEHTVVSFGMAGLGDPFYRMLGHEMNPEMGNIGKLCAVLEAGGEAVETLHTKLDEQWATYNLVGAALVFRFSNGLHEALDEPTPYAVNIYDDDNGEKQAEQAAKVTRLRATDPALTLNVLARARSQVLLADAPALLAEDYIRRVLVTDDPRLVALAQATGCLPDA